MDDAEVGSEQARGLRLALAVGGIGVGALWLHSFRLGGEVGEVEVDAYLHQALGLPRFERDLLAHAANELIDHRPGRHAPYSSEVVAGDRGDSAGDHGGMAPGTDGDGTDGAAGSGGMEQQ
ncbi:hypothetical protein GCM10011374_34570 [Kocuria dechangensis]|uniref:Uncharacterized protein n=1 Tax=Kocuria dechangensis TaxID=1176249 RepID=A0A917H5R9_9MICC|nr:hypothetical protein [Kocuria dechangensis]GGG67404.1 hypothetical protein GCM10011374_34570 [Kocuria dechangensis]